MDQANHSQRLQVFLCHSSGDKPTVRDLYRRLKADGVQPWLDEEELLPGQDWEREIRRAVRTSQAIIVCLSRASVSKVGFHQKEINLVLDVADEQPEGTIFVVPVKLEECDVPDRLTRWQWVNYFDTRGYERLLKALSTRAQELHQTLRPLQTTVGKAPQLYTASMLDGPMLMRRPAPNEEDIWYGAYQLLTFSQKDRGKTLIVSADSKGHDLTIELWRGAYDGKDAVAWTQNRAEVVRSPRMQNPSLSWKIETGTYTIYFVDFIHRVESYYMSYSYHVPVDYVISYELQMR